MTYVGTPAGTVNTSTGAIIGSPSLFGPVGVALTYWTTEGHSDVVVCPGSGLQDVADLGFYGQGLSGTDTLRVAVYALSTDPDHPSALMAQFTAAMTVNGATSWYNQTSGITQYHQLVGGRSYLLAWTCSVGNINPAVVSGSSGDSSYKLADYTSSGLPSTIPTAAGSDANNWILRLGVTASGGGGSPPVLTSIAPTSGVVNATCDTEFIGVTLVGTDMGGSGPTVNVPAGFTVSSLVVTGTTLATFNLKIVAGKSPGNYNITFQTADGTSGAEVFAITSGSGGLIHPADMRGGFGN